MGVTREKNMQKFIALCALCAFASALPSDFHNDVILGRRAAKAVNTPCGCFSSACKVTAPTNGGMGDCKDTMASGSTCTPTCGSDFTKVGTTSTCTNTVLTKPVCQGKPCTGLTDAKVQPTHGTKDAACANLVTAGTMNSGATCGFTCATGYVVATTTKCEATVITMGSCKVKTCDFSAVPTNGAVGDCTKTVGGLTAAACTPTCKTGYTASGTRACGANGVTPAVGAAGNNFACTANACTAASINAAVSSTTTASIAWTGSAKPTGTIGAYAGTLSSGGSGVLTCNAGYTASKTLGCAAGVVTAGKCEQDCATALAKPSSMTFTGTPTCTVGGTLKGGTTCTWGTPSAGNTCTVATCKDSTLTQSTCAKTTCDCTTAVANGAKGDCTATQAQSSSCQKVCNSGYEANVNTKCACSNVGVKTDTFSCKAKTPDTCTVTQTNGAKGGCNSVGGTTTASGTTCTTACNAGYMTQTLKTTCSNGVATCNCHSSCAPGSCYTSSASDCTACKSDDYTLTANKDSRTFTTGKCGWKYTYTSPVSMTQKASFSITAAQFKGQETKFAKGYGASLQLTTAGNWKTGCKGSAAVVSRRSSIDINFSVTSTAALAAKAAELATQLTTAALSGNLIAAGVGAALANAIKSLGKVTINGASRTGVATLTAAVAMIAGLLWQ